MPFNAALQAIHCPQEVTDIHPSSDPRVRLAFDELLITHLHLLRGTDVKSVAFDQSSISKPQQVYAVPISQTKESAISRVADSLPLKLTNFQSEEESEICDDISAAQDRTSDE